MGHGRIITHQAPKRNPDHDTLDAIREYEAKYGKMGETEAEG